MKLIKDKDRECHICLQPSTLGIETKIMDTDYYMGRCYICRQCVRWMEETLDSYRIEKLFKDDE